MRLLRLTPPNPLPPHSAVRLSSSHRSPSFFFDFANMSNPSPSESFRFLFEAALQDYEKKTGTKLVDHPLAKQLEKCDSVHSITSALQDQAQVFRKFQGDDGNVMKSLKCSVDVLYTLSTNTALGEGIGLVRLKALIGLLYS